MSKLKSISISGFKSIGDRQDLTFSDVTVCLGANGAGKSNLVSFFKMLNYMMTDGLQHFIAKNGMANSVLHFGASKTKIIEFEINFEDDIWTNKYSVSLSHGMPDAIFFSKEEVVGHKIGANNPIQAYLQSIGRSESALKDGCENNSAVENTCRVIRNLLTKCKFFQFHDTSETSRLRSSCYIESGDFLMSDAGNLPAFLYAMQKHSPKYYDRIVSHIKSIVPQFSDFRLGPSPQNQNNIFLNWIGEKGEDYLFGPHQLSDGSLRFIALATLLLQPPTTIPKVIVLDEPELGLHPAAISALAGMISIAKKHCQIILATQSPELANQFNPEDIVIVEYDKINHSTTFRKLDIEKMSEWLNNYSISELWHKNVLGGRP